MAMTGHWSLDHPAAQDAHVWSQSDMTYYGMMVASYERVTD
jgi:hypothetical protein